MWVADSCHRTREGRREGRRETEGCRDVHRERVGGG